MKAYWIRGKTTAHPEYVILPPSLPLDVWTVVTLFCAAESHAAVTSQDVSELVMLAMQSADYTVREVKGV